MSGKYKHYVNDAPPDWDNQQVKREASFLQSASWGQFQSALGRKVHFLTDPKWSCLLIEKRTPLGSYLFAPYGPTLETGAALLPSLEALKEYGRQNAVDWLRLEPMISCSPGAGLKASLKEYGGVPAPHNREPDLTRIIDLRPDADEILASISQSTRSLVRKNRREGFLDFKTSTRPGDIGIFIEMLSHVSRRNSVFFFEPDYFKQQAGLLMPAGMMHLELAFQDEKPIASALFHDFGGQSSYTFAASLPEARKANASALLLWQAMLNAKARGMVRMDLFGIAPENASAGHAWQGFTAFKSKFGGQVVAYSGTWDIALSRRYRFYRAARRIRSAGR